MMRGDGNSPITVRVTGMIYYVLHSPFDHFPKVRKPWGRACWSYFVTRVRRYPDSGSPELGKRAKRFQDYLYSNQRVIAGGEGCVGKVITIS